MNRIDESGASDAPEISNVGISADKNFNMDINKLHP